MEVVLEGVLELGHNPSSTSHKDWKSRLFVLKHLPDSKRSTLDYYKDTKKRWQKQVPIGVVSLWPWFTISVAHNCSYKFSLCITTAEHTIFVAAPTPVLMNKWHYYIQTQKLLDKNPDKGCYFFAVQPRDSDEMNALGARGECLLAVTKFEIVCALSPGRQVVGVWPLDSLRRYWCGDRIFGFYAGRRSPRGEGEYTFVSEKDEQIYATIHKSIERAKRTSSTASSEEGNSDHMGIDTRPPAPLPGNTLNTPLGSGTLGPQLPPKPSNLKMSPRSRKRMFGRAATSGDLDSSFDGDDSPKQMQRTKSHMGKWLHQAIRPNRRREEETPKVLEVEVPPIPPPPESIPIARDARSPERIAAAADDDTYSHTVHKFPGVFSEAADEHNVVSGSLYHALVHKGEEGALVQKKHLGSQEDSTLYDVAYPPTAQVKFGVIPQGEEDTYDTAYKKGDQNASPSIVKSPLSAPLGTRRELKQIEKLENGADGLTVNPLYGSKDNLLMEIAALEDSQELLNSTEVSTVAQQNSTEVGHVLNPMYGDSQQLAEMGVCKPPDKNQTNIGTANETGPTNRTVSGSPTNETLSGGPTNRTVSGGPTSETLCGGPTKETLSGGETVNLDPKGGAKTETSAQQTEDGNVSQQGAADVGAAGCVKFTRSNSEMDPNDIVRDNLGYSKVKKSNNNNHKSDGSELLGQSPPPPPIPERKYSNGDC